VKDLLSTVDYIVGFTGFHEFAEFTAADVGTVDSGLNSMVLASNNERVLLPINEPTSGGKRKSQILTVHATPHARLDPNPSHLNPPFRLAAVLGATWRAWSAAHRLEDERCVRDRRGNARGPRGVRRLRADGPAARVVL